jgi:SAM-dependent methyltransferase
MLDAKTRAAFETIYTEDQWGNGSGPGSSPTSTIEYRGFIERFMHENDVRSVTDLGCGDWQFSRLMDWTGIDYAGLDIVEFLIEQNRERFARENIRFDLLENTSDLPGGDLLLCKEVLQHLPNETVSEYVSQISSKYRYSLITNAIEPAEAANSDIPAGGWRPLRLDRSPFLVKGATIFTYYPQRGSHFWRNGVFLIVGA